MISKLYKPFLICALISAPSTAAWAFSGDASCTLRERCFIAKACEEMNQDGLVRISVSGNSATLSLGPQTLPMTLIAEHQGVKSWAVHDPKHFSTGVVTLEPDGAMRIASHDLSHDAMGDFSLFAQCALDAKGKKKG